MNRSESGAVWLAAMTVLLAGCTLPAPQTADQARQATSTSQATTAAPAPTPVATASTLASLPADGGMPHLDTVGKVVDGDTFDLADGTRVRFIGVDTPENTFDHECWGKEAGARLKELLPRGATVMLTADVVSDKDQFGRLLRYVDIAGPGGIVDVGELLVSEGLAESTGDRYPEQLRRAAYDEAQAEAQTARVGMWGPRPDTDVCDEGER